MRTFKFILKIVSFLAILLGCLNSFTYVLRDKTCAEEYKPFFDEQIDYDVYALGTSVTRGGVSPLDLWNNYGIVSYNLAMSGQTLQLNYYNLKSAFNVDKPKVVIADVSYIFLENQSGGEERRHQLIDNMPWEYGKLNTIVEIIDPSDWTDYLFNISYYHERWKNLSYKDFEPVNSLNKGCILSSFARDSDGNYIDTVEKFDSPLTIIPRTEKKKIPAEAVFWTEKIINLCKEQNVEIIFVAYPAYAYGEVNHGDGNELQKMWNEFSDMAAGHGIKYINYMHELEKISFIPGEDLTDWRHLSYTGAEKVTNDLGKILVSEFDIPDRRDERELNKWNEQWDELARYKQSLSEQELKEESLKRE